MQEKAMFNLHQSDLSSFEKLTYASFAVLNIHLLDQCLYLSNCASKTYQIIKLWVITSLWSTTQLWWALFTASIAFLQFKWRIRRTELNKTLSRYVHIIYGIRMNLRVNTVKICLIRAACSPFRVLETNARVDKVISDNDKVISRL